MRPVYITSEHILTSLGFSAEAHVEALKNGVSGVAPMIDTSLSEIPGCISKVNQQEFAQRFGELEFKESYTFLEQMMRFSIQKTLKNTKVKLSDSRTLLIISTTKGNIDLLHSPQKDQFSKKRLYLGEIGRVLGKALKCANEPVIVSNACISGALGVIIAQRLIEQEKYDHVLVCGADLASKFVISGFQSLKAMSEKPCRPYDKERDGINLGEGCASLLLSADKNNDQAIRVLGGATSNDANHISGPSRTGEGLFQAIQQCFRDTQMTAEDIDFISAHGTATLYNDEMESIAFQRSNLLKVPVNSFKGYIGHTLGAAGTIESVMSIISMKTNLLFPSLGYENLGVSNPMNIIKETTEKDIKICLKTASGFGGCNAAVLFAKES